jgi:hypothetical protein
VDPEIDQLRHLGPLLPQLMAQFNDSAWQIREFSQQQQRLEVALLDLDSELYRLKSFRCCAADRWALCQKACSGSALRQMVDYKVNHTSPGIQAVLPSMAGRPGGCPIHGASEPVRLRPCAVRYAAAHSVEPATARWTEPVRRRSVEGEGIRL